MKLGSVSIDQQGRVVELFCVVPEVRATKFDYGHTCRQCLYGVSSNEYPEPLRCVADVPVEMLAGPQTGIAVKTQYCRWSGFAFREVKDGDVVTE